MKRFVILLVVFISLIASPVLAVSNPDTVSITKVHATQDVLEAGDILFMAEYNIAYTVLPDENINDVFLFRMIDTDGTTELGRVTAYPLVNGGYGKGVISFYFDAATAPGTDQYTIRVTGNPAVFPSFVAQNFTMPSSAYTAYSAVADTDIRTQVMIYAADLDPTYSPVLGASLIALEDGATTTTLSTSGEIYFSNSVSNLINMSPSLFFVQASTPNTTPQSFNTTQADAYENRFVGTWVKDSQDAFFSLFNTEMQVAMGMVVLALCIVWGLACQLLSGRIEGAYILAGNTLLGGTLLGWVSMAFMSVIVFLAAVYIGVILIYRGVQT